MSAPEPLDDALARLRAVLVDPDDFVRAVGSGRRRGPASPSWRRVELRPVDLKGVPHLQITAYDLTQAHTANHPVGETSRAIVDQLLAEPFGHWGVESRTAVHQLRVTKKGLAEVRRTEREVPVDPDRTHDRAKRRILDEDDPLLAALGIVDGHGRVRRGREAKLRQVEEFVRQLDAALDEALAGGHLRTPTEAEPLHVVDLGCGNAYLTLAAFRYLSAVRELPVRLTGVDVKEQSRHHNDAVVERAGLDPERVRFVASEIEAYHPDGERPDVVLALHACDTATDDALARAVAWDVPLVLAAPCCHHDLSAQLRQSATPSPFGSLTRHGILRERFADTLTDALREMLLRLAGYRVDVVEFVDSAHTPRNTLLRAVRTGGDGRRDAVLRADYDALVSHWDVRPRLETLLGHERGGAGGAGAASASGAAADAVG